MDNSFVLTDEWSPACFHAEVAYNPQESFVTADHCSLASDMIEMDAHQRLSTPRSPPRPREGRLGSALDSQASVMFQVERVRGDVIQSV